MKFKEIKLIKERLSGFYYIIKEIVTVIFKIFCVMAMLTIVVGVFKLMMTASPLKPKSYYAPSENAKVYELVSVKQSKSFLGSIYYEILYMDENGEIYENREFKNNNITTHIVIGDENKYVTENYDRYEYNWLYITEETFKSIND